MYLIYQKDNLKLMKRIPNDTIDLIYCDILYGTGRKFDYQDLKPVRSEIEAHYIPRIKEMHRILKLTGSIYLQMDTRINHWIRCIMDDIFGYDRFLNEIAWCYVNGGNSLKWFNKKHDIILLYSKTCEYTFNTQYIEYSKKTLSNYKQGLKGSRGKLSEGVKLRDWWDDITHASKYPKNSENNIGYYTSKPLKLIERIIKTSSNEGGLVADFYLGSGTTAKVALELNRDFIGCDINSKAIEITKERIKRFTL